MAGAARWTGVEDRGVPVKIVVVGAGMMGAQIAVEFALGGHGVQVVSRNPTDGRRGIEEAITSAVGFGLCSAEQGSELGAAIVVDDEPRAGFDLAIESIPEDRQLKVECLGRLAKLEPDAILASNTSSLSVGSLAEGEEYGSRLVAMHYWRPPLLMPLVEVVPGPDTEPKVVERVEALLTELGKSPVVLDRDVPGFIWNRLQFALLREAIWLVEQGVASPESVDRVVREGLGRRWRRVGPFQAAAIGGRDTWITVGRNLAPELSTASDVNGLPDVGPDSDSGIEALRAEIDARLRADLLADKS